MCLSSQEHKLLHLYSHVFFQLIYKCEYTSVYSCDMHSHLDFLNYMSSTFLLSLFLYISYSFCCYCEWRCVYYILYMILLKLLLSYVFYILLTCHSLIVIDNNCFLQTHFDFLGSQGHPI